MRCRPRSWTTCPDPQVAADVDRLTLLIPGLAGPVSDRPITDYIQARPVALDRLLSRSTVQPVPHAGMEAVLCQLFGVSADGDLPVAPLCYLADRGVPPTGYLLRADPVHLRADQSRLRLFESHSFFITQDEADALVGSINEFNAALGWQLSAVCPQRWYLSLPAAPALQTSTPAQVAGRDIDAFLARGNDAARWHALINELQMLLHDHPVNQAREQRGEPVINSLWLWGGGVLPASVRAEPDAVYADDVLAQGLARHAGVGGHAVPEYVGDLLSDDSGRHRLLVLDGLAWPAHYNDIEGWLVQLGQLERTWFMPLLIALNSGHIGSLIIETCSGRRFSTDRRRQRAFWKRMRRFEAVITG
jgi:hypothetical protein